MYVPRHRNKVADGLPRTLFEITRRVQAELAQQGCRWIRKDGKGGFTEIISSFDQSQRSEVLDHGTIGHVPVFATAASADESWHDAYMASQWFGEIYRLLKGVIPNPNSLLLKKAFNHQVVGDILWSYRRDTYLPCIPESKVLQAVQEAHDDDGYWAKTGTLVHLRNNGYYWPDQSQDVERYIAGCLECARHGPATRSQPLHSMSVTFPLQLMGMEFIGPLDTCKSGAKYILNNIF